MAISASPIIASDGVLTFTDGAALSFTLMYEDGDLQVSGLKKDMMTQVVFKDRGIPYAIRDTEREEAIEFSFTCHLIAVVGDGTSALIGDVIKRQKAWSAATSTLPAAAGGGTNGTYTVQMAWTAERSNFGATNDTGLTLKYCHLSEDYADGLSGAKISVKGRAFCISNDYITFTG